MAGQAVIRERWAPSKKDAVPLGSQLCMDMGVPSYPCPERECGNPTAMCHTASPGQRPAQGGGVSWNGTAGEEAETVTLTPSSALSPAALGYCGLREDLRLSGNDKLPLWVEDQTAGGERSKELF